MKNFDFTPIKKGSVLTFQSIDEFGDVTNSLDVDQSERGDFRLWFNCDLYGQAKHLLPL